MQKKRLFFAGAVLCLLVALWLYKQYQEPRTGVELAKADFSITAEALYSAFSQNEKEADKKYGGKVLEVSGVIADVQAAGPAINVLLSSGSAAGGVNCSFIKNDNRSKLLTGAQVTVKGRCAGFLMDVSLVDAVQIK
jgi:hypothetical protein